MQESSNPTVEIEVTTLSNICTLLESFLDKTQKLSNSASEDCKQDKKPILAPVQGPLTIAPEKGVEYGYILDTLVWTEYLWNNAAIDRARLAQTKALFKEYGL